MFKAIVTVTLLMFPLLVQQGFASIWNSNVASGAWSNAGSWTTTGGTPDLTSGGNTVNILSGDSITRTGGLTVGGGGANTEITVENGGVLYITGALALDGSAVITVESGGKLIVDGAITTPGGGESFIVNNGGTAILNGNITFGSGSAGTDLTFDGDVTVNGNISISGLSRFNIGTTGVVNMSSNNVTFVGTTHADWEGLIDLNNLTSSGDSKINIMDGATNVLGTLRPYGNSRVTAGTGPGGILGWGIGRVNIHPGTGSSGTASIKCAGSATAYDHHVTSPQNPPPNNPLNLNGCGPGCFAIVPGAIAGDQTICNGADVVAFTSTTSASGGDGATYDYQWQSSTTSAIAGFSDIALATSETYNHGTLNTTTWFRRNVTSNICGTESSDAVMITVHPVLVAGTIGTAQTIFHSTAPSELTDVAPATGGGGFTYQWQDSPDGTTWANIGSATAVTYSPGLLTNDTWYRRSAISTAGCGTVYSADVKITVQVILSCGNAAPNSTVLVAPSGGVGGFTYQWQSSPDNAVWTDIGGETDPTLDNQPAPGSSVWYRRGVFNNGCGPIYTNSIQAQVADGPGGVPGDLVVWLKAENATPGLWTDNSGNGNDYTGVGTPTVVTNGDSTSNYNPFVEILNGGYDAPAGSELGTEYTIITVATKLASDNDGRIFDGHTGDYCWGDWGAYTKSLNTNGSPALHNSGLAVASGNGAKKMQTFVRQSGGAIVHRVDGVVAGSYGSSASANGIRVDINQGAFAGSEESDSRVYEMLIYNTALTSAEVDKIESYLMTKYGMRDVANYLSSTGGTTYKISSHANDIIGLGKECYFEQKQSESEDDSVKVFVSTLAASNAVNGGTITNDVSYLLLGHDGGQSKSTAAAIAETPAIIEDRLEREWKITNTNFDDDFSLEIEVDGFDAHTLANLRLLVDGDGDFTDATIYGPADGLTFSYGSIIIGGIGTSIFGAGTTSFFTIGSIAIVLPVDLVSFYAVKKDDAVELTWQTAMEINNDHFVVQRSNTGLGDWNEVGQIPGHGSSHALLTYHFLDRGRCDECYYRLIQVDYDGTETISDVVSVTSEYDIETELELYPNPAEKTVSLDVVSGVDGNFAIEVYTVEGASVMSLSGELITGQNTLTIQLDYLASGLYYLEFKNKGGGRARTAMFSKF